MNRNEKNNVQPNFEKGNASVVNVEKIYEEEIIRGFRRAEVY